MTHAEHGTESVGATANGSYRAFARFDGRSWNVRVDRADGSLAGGLAASGLDLVVRKTRDLVEDPTAEVTVEVMLLAATEQRLEMAEQLVEDATKELEMVILELRDSSMSVADIGYVFTTRRLRPDPRPILITNAEIAELGLSRHPDAVGVRWSDHGFAETTKCRTCVEATRAEYVELPGDGANELLYNGPVDCDFFDIDHLGQTVNSVDDG